MPLAFLLAHSLLTHPIPSTICPALPPPQVAALRRENAGLLRDRLDGDGSSSGRGSSEADAKRLKGDVKRLADQNAKLTKELSAFDLVR